MSSSRPYVENTNISTTIAFSNLNEVTMVYMLKDINGKVLAGIAYLSKKPYITISPDPLNKPIQAYYPETGLMEPIL